MRKITAQKLSHEAFAPFGQYTSISGPRGLALTGDLHSFYPDRLVGYCGKNIGFSPIVVKKPSRYLISQVECHTTTWEIIMPISGDMLLHVSPKSGLQPKTELTQAFIIPQNTMVRIDAAVWHLAPLPVEDDTLYALIVLPECTYANDCHVVDLAEYDQFEIVL